MESFISYLNEISQGGISSEIDVGGFSFTIAVSILFGLTLKVLYNLYFRDNEPQDGSLARSLVIITPALTATFWMIHSSPVLSLGLLGSMSIIRFRTPIKRPEDIAFVIITLGVSIALAISKIPIAAILVGLLFVYTYLKDFTILSLSKDKFAVITFNTKEKISIEIINKKLADLKIKSEFISSRTYDGISSYVFNATQVEKDTHDKIIDYLTECDKSAHINVFYPNERLGA